MKVMSTPAYLKIAASNQLSPTLAEHGSLTFAEPTPEEISQVRSVITSPQYREQVAQWTEIYGQTTVMKVHPSAAHLMEPNNLNLSKGAIGVASGAVLGGSVGYLAAWMLNAVHPTSGVAFTAVAAIMGGVIGGAATNATSGASNGSGLELFVDAKTQNVGVRFAG